MKLREVIENYLTNCQARGLRPASLITYRQQLYRFAAYADTVGVDDLTTLDVDLCRAYLAQINALGQAAATANTAARCLRVFLDWAVREGLLEISPMRRVPLPKLDAPKPDAFTIDQVNQLLDATRKQRDRALVLFLLDTGARIGEAFGLKMGDVATDGTVTLHSDHTKSRRTRTVFLGERARAAMDDYLAETARKPKTPVWRDANGKPLSLDGFKEILKRLGRRAGVQPSGAHKFRRTHALWCIRAGMDTQSLGRLLGHSDESLLKYYVGLEAEDLRAAHAAHGPVDHLLK